MVIVCIKYTKSKPFPTTLDRPNVKKPSSLVNDIGSIPLTEVT